MSTLLISQTKHYFQKTKHCFQSGEWKQMFYLTTHSTHFIYGYMASDIWLRTILIVRKETRCLHMCYSFRLTARVLLYAPSHRQDNTYHGLCYTSCGALAGMRNSSMGNVLFNDALNTFYLRLYGVRHMVKDHSDSERKPAAAKWATLSK